MENRSSDLPMLNTDLNAHAASLGSSPGLRIVSCSELIEMELPERGHILYPIIPEQGLVMLYAPRGLGKTWLALSIANAVSCGQDVLEGWRAEVPRRVLYLDGEMSARDLKDRIAAIDTGAMGMRPAPDYLRILTPDLQPEMMPNISTPYGQALLKPFLEDVDLIVVDNIATLGRHGRENEVESWLPIQEWLLSLRRSGKSVLLVHHAGKGGGQRGTSAREDILDTVIAMKRPEGYRAEEGAKFEIHVEKARGFAGSEAKPFVASLLAENGAALWITCPIESEEIDRVKSLKAKGMSIRDIAKETGIAKSTIGRIVQRVDTTS